MIAAHLEELMLGNNSLSTVEWSPSDQSPMFGKSFVNISLMKNLTYLESRGCEIIDGLIGSLPRLKILSIRNCRDNCDLILKDLPYLTHFRGEALNYPRIQIQGTSVSSAINYIKFVAGFKLKEILVQRKAFEMTITCGCGLRRLLTTEQISYLIVADCPGFETYEGPVVYSSINEEHTSGNGTI
jgi:hypothetical protein